MGNSKSAIRVLCWGDSLITLAYTVLLEVLKIPIHKILQGAPGSGVRLGVDLGVDPCSDATCVRRAFRSPYVPHICATYVPHMCHICSTYVPHMCPIYVPHMCHICAPYVPHMCHICATYVLHICATYVPHMRHICAT